jgi:hypothetical protein
MEQEVIEEEVSLFDDGGQPEPQAAEVAPEEKDETPAIPEKFQGKSMEDVIQSYVNLEKEYGNKSNEIGELRKLTDQILLNQAQQQQAPARQAEDINEDVGFDDFIEDPKLAVNKALETNPTIQRLEQHIEAQAVDASRQALLSAHPDAEAVVASPEFQNWIAESPGRAQMLQAAHVNRNVDVAVDMLNMYKQTKQVTNDEAVTERDAKAKADLKRASVETGGRPSGGTKKVYRRAELIELKLRDPARYEAMRDEIHQAYAEKRVR